MFLESLTLFGFLNMGGLHEVSRQVNAWHRQPDPALQKKLGPTTNYKA